MAQIEKVFEAEENIDPDYAGREISQDKIEAGAHRTWVGGRWDKAGQPQLEFLKSKGLKPHHKFLDVGCGSFRAGRHFIDYLDPGNYYGIDANLSVIQAGWDHELSKEQLEKLPIENLRATDRFGVDFGVKFDFAIAQSVFTHISLNFIRLCLYRVGNVMQPNGLFYATFNEAKKGRELDYVERIRQTRGKYQERNVFWYYRQDMRWVARRTAFAPTYIGEWGHGRGQRMMEYRAEG